MIATWVNQRVSKKTFEEKTERILRWTLPLEQMAYIAGKEGEKSLDWVGSDETAKP